MLAVSNPERARSFDAVAAAYDAGRPGYPETLIDEAIRLSGIGPGGAILEIGCGTGQASVPFARRGYRLLCLEPGPNLAALARRNLYAHPGATVLDMRFEDWPLAPGTFDVVLAATALHHVAVEQRYTRTARALKPGGALVILGSHPGTDDPDFRAELDACYTRWWGAASTREYADWTLERRINWTRDAIVASGCFDPPAMRHEEWSMEYDLERYMAWLDSDSGRLKHPPAAQEGLKADIASLIVRRGGTVRRGVTTILAVARRA